MALSISWPIVVKMEASHHCRKVSKADSCFVSGHMRKGREERHRHHRQEEISGAIRFDGRAVRVCHSQENQVVSGEGNLYIR